MKKTIKQLLFSVLASCLVLVGYAQQRTVPERSWTKMVHLWQGFPMSLKELK